MKKALSAILSLLLLIQLAACSGTQGKTEDTEPDGPVELVLATDSLFSQLGAMVNRFNESHEDYKIKVRRYGDSAETTIDLLRTEIIAGQAPDIYVFSQDWFSDVQIPMYEDLLPYLNSDPDYGRETFVPSLFDTITAKGHLLFLPADFFITSFTAPESIVGDRTEITMAEADEFAKTLGEDAVIFPSWMSREVLLNYVISSTYLDYVDFEEGTCDFLDPEFVMMLEQCMKMQPDSNPSGETGQALRERPSLLFNSLIQSFDAFGGLHYMYGTDYSFVGFPSDNGSGSRFVINTRLSISADCKHKGTAWEFVRMVMSDEVQKSVEYLPVVQSELDRRIGEALNADPEMGEVRLEKCEIDKFNALLASVKTLEAESDSVIFSIVRDEASRFFAGECTAEEAADIIQSRVSIYVAERK